ncbi:hypothetical protein DBV15_12848, partial [Temnothorax longispinosus]
MYTKESREARTEATASDAAKTCSKRGIAKSGVQSGVKRYEKRFSVICERNRFRGAAAVLLTPPRRNSLPADFPEFREGDWPSESRVMELTSPVSRGDPTGSSPVF